MEPAHLVGIGGAIGAVARFFVAQRLVHERFPLATLVVNVLGSAVLGLVVGVGANADVVLFLGVGACGAFTTYSSFSVETVRLWETGEPVRAAVYAAMTFALCAVAAGAGVVLGSTLVG